MFLELGLCRYLIAFRLKSLRQSFTAIFISRCGASQTVSALSGSATGTAAKLPLGALRSLDSTIKLSLGHSEGSIISLETRETARQTQIAVCA